MAEARYDKIAELYQAGWPDSYGDPVTAAVFDLLGDIEGMRVLDVACGHGRITRELARRGARVVGIDLSGVLLDMALASEANERLGITYVHADVAAPASLEGETFDAVACSFGLSDIDDLHGVAATIARVLTPMGRFVFSILHPCFAGEADASGSWPTSGTYYDEGWWLADRRLSVLRREVGANHRMLSTYFNTLRRHGLAIDHVAEPVPPGQWRERRPESARMPVFLVARATRLGLG